MVSFAVLPSLREEQILAYGAPRQQVFPAIRSFAKKHEISERPMSIGIDPSDDPGRPANPLDGCEHVIESLAAFTERIIQQSPQTRGSGCAPAPTRACVPENSSGFEKIATAASAYNDAAPAPGRIVTAAWNLEVPELRARGAPP